MRDVNRKATSAAQFWGSAIVKAPTGGRKKKLKHNVDKIDIRTAYLSPQVAATTKIAISRLSATVVGLT
jgi:hypothetical protein